MVIIIHILTVLLAVATFFIIKNKRYKVVPLVSWVIFIFFIGCGTISAVSLLVPYGEIFVLPLGGIVFGLVFILAAFNDFYSLIRCKEKIDAYIVVITPITEEMEFLHNRRFFNILITEHCIKNRQHKISHIAFNAKYEEWRNL